VVPDSHDDPSVSQERYTWLGQFILDTKPDVVMELGDFADLHSLSSYDKGTVKAENARLERDIASAKEARRKVTQPLRDYQDHLKRLKMKVWKPRLIALCGNHEHRVTRYMNENPNLYGMFSPDVSGAEQLGWEWVPFGDVINVAGIDFCHYFTKPGIQRGYSGEYACNHIIRDYHASCVQGHSHRWEYKRFQPPGKPVCIALMAGCYFEHHADYAGRDNDRWCRGLTILNNCHNGSFDVEQVSMDVLRARYGGA
jgi:hypothetical protein